MSIKNLSKATSALALVGVVAPFLVQSVDAAVPSSALSGVGGVSDPSGSEIINKAAQSAGGSSGTANGTSHAGIGFESGDLILYQVPNFDFTMNNKIAADTYKMIDASNDGKSNRMAVVVDNRYTSKGAKASDNKSSYNWTLSAKAGDFKTSDDQHKLTMNDVRLLINDENSLTYNIPTSQYQKGDKKDKLYVPGDSTPSPDGLQLASAGINILLGEADAPVMIAQSNDSELPGATGISFLSNNSAEFEVLAGDTQKGVSQIVPKEKYISDINWTLSSDPLN